MNPLDKGLIEHCIQAEAVLSQENGGFILFGLFARDESAGKWDILAAAPWLTTDRAGIQRIVDALMPLVEREEWGRVGSVVPLDPESDYVRSLLRRHHVEHGWDEVAYTAYNGVFINNAIIVTANKDAASDATAREEPRTLALSA